MKASRLKRIIRKVRHLIDRDFAKKLKRRGELVETFTRMKARKKELKEQVRRENDPEKLRKLLQELEIVKALKKKAKKLLKEDK